MGEIKIDEVSKATDQDKGKNASQDIYQKFVIDTKLLSQKV